MKYERMTTERLLNTAAWVDTEAEATQEEKARAKKLIKDELSRRFNAVLEFLEDGQNAQNPAGSFDYLMNG